MCRFMNAISFQVLSYIMQAYGGSIKDSIGKGANIVHSDFDNSKYSH